MPYSNTPDNLQHQKSFRIKHEDDKFFTKLISKETSKSNPSFRIYYGNVPSAVPFTWETRPGTPKHAFSDNFNVPPLTPPPSYYTDNKSLNSSKKNSRSKFLLHTLLRRMNPNKRVCRSSSPSSASSRSSTLSWSSSSRSLFSDPIMTPNCVHRRTRSRFLSWGSSNFDEKAMDDEMCSSRFCFGSLNRKDNGEEVQRRYSVLIMKKALLSIVGRGSA